MEPVDFSVLNDFRELMGDDGDAEVRELVNLYLEDGPDQLASMRSSLAAGDWDVLKRAAHSFKSSCGNIGAMELQALCLKLEQAVAEDNSVSDDVRVLVTQAEAAFADVEEALRTYLNA